jgi:hypothetical protein
MRRAWRKAAGRASEANSLRLVRQLPYGMTVSISPGKSTEPLRKRCPTITRLKITLRGRELGAGFWVSV